jgi:hypothetical protein
MFKLITQHLQLASFIKNLQILIHFIFHSTYHKKILLKIVQVLQMIKLIFV